MKRIITTMGVLGVLVAFMACSSDDSSSTEPKDDQTATEDTQKVSSSSTSKDKATSSESSKKSSASKSKDNDSKKADSDTVIVEQYVSAASGYEDPYFSSGIFCWTDGCEANLPSSSSVSPTKKSSASKGGASIDEPSKEPPEINSAQTQMTDKRDNKKYKLQKVGSSLWMAQDLNFEMSSSKCFDDSESNCTKYGRLYTFSAAEKACPSGWRLPKRDEAKALINAESYPWSYSGRCKTGECSFTGQMGFHWTAATPQDGDKNFDSNKGDGYTVIIVEKEPDYADNETQKFFQVDDKEKYFSVRCIQGE